MRAGERAQLGHEVVAHAGVEELVELGAVLVGDAERRIAGVDELTGRVHQAVEHRVESQLAGDREDHIAHCRERVVARDGCHVVHPTSVD